jgi:hypothetical protein
VVDRGSTRDLLGDGEASLADQLALDRSNATLAPCARFVEASSEVTIGLRVSSAGAVTAASGDGSRAQVCLAQALAGRRLAPGRERVLEIQYTLSPDLPALTVELDSPTGIPSGLEPLLEEMARDARLCLPRATADASLPHALVWSVKPSRKTLAFSWVADRDQDEKPVSAAVAACIEKRVRPPSWAALLAAREDDEEREDTAAAGAEALGVAHFSVRANHDGESAAPQATTLLGYELLVTARAGDGKKELGSTPFLLRPGTVPPVRLRATPVVAQAGGEVEVSVLRGPSFTQGLPKTLLMTHAGTTLEAALDSKARAARFKLPADAQGWFEVSWGGARALVFVRPRAELAVTIHPDAERYAPGQTASLAIHTTAGSNGTAAAVGLFGVDATLADLAPLPGPDELARVRPHPQMRSQAFDALDVGALEMGRVRGANAATATVLRVSTLPDPQASDVSVNVSVRTPFDAIAPLTENFYNALGELHGQVRAWEEHAAKGAQMHPPEMAKLWSQALEACERRQEPVSDAYGRRLRLSRLPPDLLAQTDPRAVVVDGTRLPEDVESWTAWVQKEQP